MNIPIYRYPSSSELPAILRRPQINNTDVLNTVNDVASKVIAEGDAALRYYTNKFDGVPMELLASLEVSEGEIQASETLVPQELRTAITTAAHNIKAFHNKQQYTPYTIETMQGVKCSRKAMPIERVGLYVPGGTAPLLSTVLMLAIPANIAGCKEIILCTPPQKDGTVHPAILYAAKVSGVSRIYKVGGAQAIIAMAKGTETIPSVQKIFGPGNKFVTAAKQIVQTQHTAIDMPAGPSEVLIIADGKADPAFIAADLLSQAEHGAESQSILLTDNETLISRVEAELKLQLQDLPRSSVATEALSHSRLILVKDLSIAIELSNLYAPEHLIINTENAEELSLQVQNAGSVFIGAYTPESAGDYASGTNHTLPTDGYARMYSGVGVEAFQKYITFQNISQQGLSTLAPTLITMAEAEHLTAHANAVRVRLIAK